MTGRKMEPLATLWGGDRCHGFCGVVSVPTGSNAVGHRGGEGEGGGKALDDSNDMALTIDKDKVTQIIFSKKSYSK